MRTAHTTSGDAISEVIAFEGERMFARIITPSFQTLYVWLPLSCITLTATR